MLKHEERVKIKALGEGRYLDRVTRYINSIPNESNYQSDIPYFTVAIDDFAKRLSDLDAAGPGSVLTYMAAN
jgi:hypothetical protein